MSSNKNTTTLICGSCEVSAEIPNGEIRAKASAHRERGGVCKACFAKGLKPTVVARQVTTSRKDSDVVIVVCANGKCMGEQLVPARSFVKNGETVEVPERLVKARTRVSIARKDAAGATCSPECAAAVAERKVKAAE